MHPRCTAQADRRSKDLLSRAGLSIVILASRRGPSPSDLSRSHRKPHEQHTMLVQLMVRCALEQEASS